MTTQKANSKQQQQPSESQRAPTNERAKGINETEQTRRRLALPLSRE